MSDSHSPRYSGHVPAVAKTAAKRFAELYRRAPVWIVVAPGRVNLIGEHIDYNDGYVLPMAIDRYTAIAADRADSGRVRVSSGQMNDELSVDATTFEAQSQPTWTPYVIGPLALCAQRQLQVGSIDACIESDVPTGAGLSSSAALEVAAATLAEVISGHAMDPMEKAKLCQRAEHEYAGVPCGIMDQATSVAATAGHAMLLDCKTGDITQVPMVDADIAVLIVNSNVKHALSDGEYGKRRAECEQAMSELEIDSFRGFTREALDARRDRVSSVPFRRARHVINETERTIDAVEAMRSSDWPRFGSLMYDSHASLRDDYEVSCGELDLLVELASGIGTSGGVFGSRMTGGGFGGCTVSLVAADAAADISRQLRVRYQQQTGIEPTLFLTGPAQGAQIVTDV